MTFRRFLFASVGAASIAATLPANAQQVSISSVDIGGVVTGPVYYGFVRDHRGSPVADARVVLQPKGGQPLELKSNVLGLYRSHVSKEFRPDDISVSCDKTGYKQVNVARRNPHGSSEMNIETNCTMQRL